MSALEQMSANARKQHEEDIERLVKCRLRSEIKARRAVKSTMKRAVLEARELKKELVLLWQENEELHAAAQKSPGFGKDSTSELKDDPIQRLTARNKELESNMCELQQKVSGLESPATTVIDHTTALAEKDRKIADLEDELAKIKLVADETKRKCQHMLKEKRDEAQRALQENEQLARCAKTLQSQLALLPQLKRQLELTNKKRADTAEVWQKKLEQRDQTFLREEEANKQKLAESAFQIAELTEEKLELQERLNKLEIKLRKFESNHKSELSQESQRMIQLETSMNQWHERLVATEALAKEAEQAEVVARETREQETKLRQLTDDADAVGAQADYDLVQARGIPKAHCSTIDRMELTSNNEDERDR
ncbi:hypothetical protein PR003_g10909 [Phytophthora rubi]|uniref:Uncharacterized protein n=1 Tax=Phytophthora rubi TaxID=129364 RepID=A0A6A4F4G3_9STRA|nr:hypothetical protein PR002_g10173 [Phytophthora rubi]KAE9034956.1 hypothetical protein PR001_g9512 [Phytophthora rubi]KAE9339641.1 hypothetical protein PR003_g10909 [Phytophthora rubi]